MDTARTAVRASTDVCSWPNSAVADSYPGRRLSGDKLPARGEPRQRDVTNSPLPCRELASRLTSSMKIRAPLIGPGTEFDAVRATNTYGARNAVT